MRVTITTDGGFTGRGIGGVEVDSVANEALAHALRDARPETWRDEYTTRGADQVRYTLTFGDRSVSWIEGAEIPADLRALFECAWKLRA
ncbi:MAG TPA: hypothetical protein VFN10_12830 [Thermoanaerobaculia bacterium]|nr:hypothetical protein [Thermoanaerobaculia bacterium]